MFLCLHEKLCSEFNSPHCLNVPAITCKNLLQGKLQLCWFTPCLKCTDSVPHWQEMLFKSIFPQAANWRCAQKDGSMGRNWYLIATVFTCWQQIGRVQIQRTIRSSYLKAFLLPAWENTEIAIADPSLKGGRRESSFKQHNFTATKSVFCTNISD